MKTAKHIENLQISGVQPTPDKARHMRIIATSLLCVMAVIFIATLQLEKYHPAWGYATAFAEAALVGGLADWFAVTALFRHPLGLPIPHTAIIPTNKNRIADTMAAFLRTNFLIPQVLGRRLQNMNAAGAIGRFLTRNSQDRRPGEDTMRMGVSYLAGDVLESLDKERLGSMIKNALHVQLDKLDIAPLLGQVLNAAIADQRHTPIIDSLIRWAARTLEANDALVRDMVHEKASTIMRWTGLDDRLANAVVSGLQKLLNDVAQDPDHPLREKVEEGLSSLAHDLLHDADMQARVRDIKAEMLANPAIAKWMDGIWERGRKAMLSASRDPDRTLSGQFGESLDQVGQSLIAPGNLQMQVNRFARRTLVGISSRYGDKIVKLVSETVRRWDTQTITGRVENAVGRDLQFIRINGTIVGGLVGLLLHAIITISHTF